MSNKAIHTLQELQIRQALPLCAKIQITKLRVRDWVNEFGIDGVYISFSGGKDSTVLLHICRELYPNMRAMFVDTGLEYPEIRSFVRSFDNVDIIRPEMNFKQVIEKYGYPIISKEVSKDVYYSKTKIGGAHWRKLHGEKKNDNGEKSIFNNDRYVFLESAPFPVSSRCCDIMKKKPAHKYGKETGRVPITAQMAAESLLRQTNWLRHGCNAFDSKYPVSNPLSFWRENDILQYIKENNIEICSVYGEIVPDYQGEQFSGQMDFCDFGLVEDNRKLKTTGCDRTGCMFCLYGAQREKAGEGRFERMKKTHPKQYDFIMRPKEKGGLNYKAVIDWTNEHGGLNIRY